MTDLRQILFDIGGISSLLVVFCFLLLLKFHRAENNSLHISSGVIVLASFLMHSVELKLFSLAETDRDLAKYLWYISFVLIDVVSAYVLYKIHVVYNVKVSRLSFFTLYSLFALTGVQLLRFVDRLIFETDLLGSFYQYSIVIINISIVSTIIFSTIIALFQFSQESRQEA